MGDSSSHPVFTIYPTQTFFFSFSSKGKNVTLILVVIFRLKLMESSLKLSMCMTGGGMAGRKGRNSFYCSTKKYKILPRGAGKIQASITTAISQTRNPPSFQPQPCLALRHAPLREGTDLLYLHPSKSCRMRALLGTGWKQRGQDTGILLLNSAGQAPITVPPEELVREVRSYQRGRLPNAHVIPEVNVITVLSTSVFLTIRYSCTS